jgi:histidinol-phosphatase (PHP family)
MTRAGSFTPGRVLPPTVSPRHAHDYHVHSNYSDGEILWKMVRAAEAAGLSGVGIADHCNVSAVDRQRRRAAAMGFTLDITYERRREAIDLVGGYVDVAVFDAVEMDYDPDDEARIAAFLDEAGFEYAIGSVHALDGANVHSTRHFEGMTEAERRGHVDRYFETLVALVDSELFEIAAHVDLIERNAALRGLATREQYDRVAEAFATSRTVPEVNAGRVDREYGEFHPTPEFLDALRARDVAFVVGSDAHAPDELERRTPLLDERFETLEVEPVELL